MSCWNKLLLVLISLACLSVFPAYGKPVRVGDRQKPRPTLVHNRYQPEKREVYGPSVTYLLVGTKTDFRIHDRPFDAELIVWWNELECELRARGRNSDTAYVEDCTIERVSAGADKAAVGSRFKLIIADSLVFGSLCSALFEVRPRGELELVSSNCHASAAGPVVPRQIPPWVPTPGGGP